MKLCKLCICVSVLSVCVYPLFCILFPVLFVYRPKVNHHDRSPDRKSNPKSRLPFCLFVFVCLCCLSISS